MRTTVKKTNLIAVLALALGAGACSDGDFASRGTGPGPSGTSGELGNGTFFYSCADDSDPVCDDGQSDFPYNQSFAVGSSFSLFYREASGSSASIESSAPDRLRESGSVLMAERPGTVAVMASSGGRMIDLLHVHIAEMEELRLDTPSGTVVAGLDLENDALTMDIGDRLILRAIPVDGDGEELVGALPMEWVSGNLAVVSFEGSSRDNDVEIVAERAGLAQIFVDMGELSRTLSVTVTGEPLPENVTAVLAPPRELTEIVPEEEGQ